MTRKSATRHKPRRSVPSRQDETAMKQKLSVVTRRDASLRDSLRAFHSGSHATLVQSHAAYKHKDEIDTLTFRPHYSGMRDQTPQKHGNISRKPHFVLP